MNSLNYILGLSPKFIGKTDVKNIRTGLIINAPANRISIGTPCFIIKNQIHKIALIPFAINNNMSHRYKLNSQKNEPNLILKEISKENIFTNCENILVDELNEVRCDEILNRIHGLNVLNIIIGPNENLKKDFKELLMFFNESFKITSLITKYFNETIALEEDGCLSIVISDIKNHLPVFDPTQSDGIYVNICGYSPKLSKKIGSIYVSFEISLAFSNYSKNLVEIDGQNINNRLVIKRSVLSDILTNNINPYLRTIGKINHENEESSFIQAKNIVSVIS